MKQRDVSACRGVTLLPGIEIVGHNTLPAIVFGDSCSCLSSTNLASDTAMEGIQLLIDSVMETFPTTPILHIGWDEVSTDAVPKADSAAQFCVTHKLAACDEAHIVDYFLTTLNDWFAAKYAGKRLMAYENVNTPGTKNRTVITQPWWINGGNGVMEDQVIKLLTIWSLVWKPYGHSSARPC